MRRKKLALPVLAALGACALLVFTACTPVGEPDEAVPEVAKLDATASPTASLSPVTENGEKEPEEREISPLPSELMFVIGETSGEYWIEILTTFDELPCGNFGLVAGVVTGESDGEVVIEIDGIALDGDICLEEVGPAGARLDLGTPAGETALRFRYEEMEDVYQLTIEPGFLTIETVKAGFTRAEYKYWRHLPVLNFYSPFSGAREYLEADMLLLYTTTAWNDGDGEALRQATVRNNAVRNHAERIFEELMALGAQPLSAEGAAYSVLYATPPLEAAPEPTHLVRFMRYDGPLEAVVDLLAARDEIRMRVYSQEGSNVPTPKPRPTRTPFIPTPTATKTPLPPTPTPTPTPSPGPVSLFTSQEVYQEGEPVVFTITNHMARPIYYRYGGCAWPVPVYVGDNIKIALKVDAPEPDPDIVALQPGETTTCTWDGQVYQNPEWGPPDSFIREQELAPAPRGQYQLRLNYAFDAAEVETITRTSNREPVAHSPVFTVFGPHLMVDLSDESRVELEVAQETFAPGSRVDFSVTNHYDRSITYTYGCSRPAVFFFKEPEGPGAVRLTLRVPDERPAGTELRAGETHQCSWNQSAWQDPSKEGRARFEAYDGASEAVQVPPGVYRFLLVYYFADPDGYASEGERLREEQMVISHPFTVTDFAEAP